MTTEERKTLINCFDADFSVREQCAIVDVNRSSYYYDPAEEREENLELMRLIDKEYTRYPFYGSRKMVIWLQNNGYEVNRKRVQRLMRIMGLEAIYPRPNLSKNEQRHKKYPYLLKDIAIIAPNMVWSTDITYIRMTTGFVYCTAIIDWFSRYVLSWKMSNTLDNAFCIEALEEALLKGIPQIFNTDQGVQFTSKEFINILETALIRVSMDSKGRALDNIFVERLWRSLKYEEVYLKEYGTAKEAREGIGRYFEFYNKERPHQSLGYRCPFEVHFGG